MARFTRDDITKQFIEIVLSVSCFDNVNLDSSFDDLAFDDLDIVECMIYSEKVFSISIPDDDWFAVKTVRDAIDCIENILEKEVEDKVIKFGNCAHNLAPNVEAFIVRMEMESESQLNFLADYIGCNLGSLEDLVMAKEVDGEDVHVTLVNLVESGMAGAAILLGLKGQVSKLANQMTDLYARKNRDYGNSFDKSMNKFGLVVAAIRIGDKGNRLQSLVAKRGEAEVKDESLADTFMDLACYSIMTMLWLHDKTEK